MSQLPLTAIIDWLEFTIKTVDLDTFVTQLLKIPKNEFNELNRGQYGYTNQLKWNGGNVSILYNAYTDDTGNVTEAVGHPMGIHVVMSGTGCRFYEKIAELGTLLYVLMGSGFEHKVTRIDLALDDTNGQFISFDQIHGATLAGDFTTRWNKWREVCERQSSDNTFTGRTMYFGSPSSELFCRIYDKTLERQAKGSDDQKVPDTWTRLELIYRKERANKLVQHILRSRDVGTLILETLNQYIRFLKRKDGDSNKSRWPTADWWDALIGQVGKLRLTTKTATKTIEEMERWLTQQMGPSLMAVMKAHEGDLHWFVNLLRSGEGRLKRKHLDAIDQYFREES